MAAEILGWLNNHSNLNIHPNSRIPALCKIVAKAVGRESQPGDDKYVELVQSFKEVQEIWLIVRVLGDRLAVAPFLDPFQRAAANDSQLPEDSGSNTTGRNAQFELFVGAIGDRVGFKVSHLGQGQPDWQMAAAIRTWTVEAKRAKSQEA